MSWFDAGSRRVGGASAAPLQTLVLALVLLILPACGFEPLYGRSGEDRRSTVDDLATVRVVPLKDRAGQQLHNLLLTRLNPKGQPTAPAYLLNIDLTRTTREVGIRKDETATRANLVLTASYALKPVDRDTVVLRGELRSFNSYNILESQFPSYVSENDALKRGLRELSDDLRIRLAAFFATKSAAAR